MNNGNLLTLWDSDEGLPKTKQLKATKPGAEATSVSQEVVAAERETTARKQEL